MSIAIRGLVVVMLFLVGAVAATLIDPSLTGSKVWAVAVATTTTGLMFMVWPFLKQSA